MPRKQRGPTARISAPVLLAVLASLVVAACGGSSKSSSRASAGASSRATATAASTPASATTTPTTTTTAPSSGGKLASLRACLAARGISVPNGGSSPLALLRLAARLPKSATRTHYEAAVRACLGAQLPPAGRTVKPRGVRNPRVIAALRRFASCMRQHQVNLPNPNTSGTGPLFNTKGLNTSSPQFRAALVMCSSALRELLKARPGTGRAAPLG